MEIDLPSKLGVLTVVGHAWAAGIAKPKLGKNNLIKFRDASLVIKAGDGFPMAYIKIEIQDESKTWTQQEVYIMPKWDSML